MKDQDQIKAIAELDGFKQRTGCVWITDDELREFAYLKGDSGAMYFTSNTPKYLTSRDTIVPVIEKLWKGHPTSFDGRKFVGQLKLIIGKDDCCEIHDKMYFLLATPQQLCEALLRATNKWKD